MGTLVRRFLVLCLMPVLLTVFGAASVFAAGYTVENVGNATNVTGINDSGQVTGLDLYDGGYTSYLYAPGSERQSLKGGISVFTYGISNDGTVAGWRIDNSLGPPYPITWKDGTFNFLAYPGDQSTGRAYAISKSGMVAGEALQRFADTEGGYTYAFRYNIKDGKFDKLGAFPAAGGSGTISDAWAINDLGQAAGSSRTGYRINTDNHRAALYELDGTVTDLGTLGGENSKATGINNLGQVIGTSEMVPGDTYFHGFLYNNGATVDMGGLVPGQGSNPAKINNNGEVVGTSPDADGKTRAVVYSDWTLQNIDTVGGTGSAALDLSDGGRVVGYVKDAAGVKHAFVYTGGSGMTDLNNLVTAGSGWVLTEADRVNEKGQIAGIGTYNGTTQAFLLTPTVHVTAFTMPDTATSLTVPVTFTAADNDGPVMYLITESAAVPAAGDPGWSSVAPATFTFSGSGTKTAYAWAKDSLGVISASVAASVTVTPSELTVSPSQPNPHVAGTDVVFTAQVAGGGSYEYRFRLYNGTDLLQEGTYSDTAAWTLPGTTLPGFYTIKVDARGAGSSVAADATASITYRVNATPAADPATGVTITAGTASPQPTGTAITFTAHGEGSSAYEYRFSLFKYGEWKMVQDYSTIDSFTLPADSPRGNYAVKVDVRGEGSANDSEATATVDYVICAPPATGVVFLESNSEWPASDELQLNDAGSGVNHMFTARGQGSTAYEYRFEMYDGTNWTEVQPWSLNSYWTLRNETIGVYQLRVSVRGASSVSAGDATATMAIRVKAAPATSVSLESDIASPQQVGTPVTFTAQAQGGKWATTFEYRFLLFKGGVSTVVQDYSSSNSWIMPAETPAGSYTVTVQARGTNSAEEYEAYKNMDFQLTVPSSDLSITSFAMPAQVIADDSAVSGWKLTDIGGGTAAQTNGINTAGRVIGSDLNAFIWDANGRTDLAMEYSSGINEAGQIIGYTLGYLVADSFLYDNGALTKLTPLDGFPNSRASAINNKGQIVGDSEAAADIPVTMATIWNNGVPSAFQDNTGKPVYGVASAINDSGDAVGTYRTSQAPGTFGVSYPVLWKNGVMIDLSGSCDPTKPLPPTPEFPDPGACWCRARGINNAGYVIGDYNDPYSRPVLWINGVPNLMPLIDGTEGSRTTAINNLGQVVGWRTFHEPSGGNAINHAVLWDKGTMVDLNTLIDPASGFTMEYAQGINDNGEIVGTMKSTTDGYKHHFRLSPTISLPVSVGSFTASDTNGIAGYLLTETTTTPATDDAGWTSDPPTSYSFTGFGPHNICAWVKDNNGNISASSCTTVNIVRNEPPVVGWFTMPEHSTISTVPISQLSAYSKIGVAGFMVTESATPPTAGDAGWSATSPASFTFSGTGTRTAYAWAKDTAGNVSAALATTVTIDTPPVISAFSLRPFSFGGASLTAGWSVTDLSIQLQDSLTDRYLSKNNGTQGYSIGYAISNSGMMAGVGFTKLNTGGSNRNDSVFWYNGTAVDLGYPYFGGTMGKSQAYGCNNNGQVVGYTRSSTVSNKPFKYSLADDSTVLVDMPAGALSAYATGINDSGWVVGYSTTTDPGTGEYTLGTAYIWKSAANVYTLIGAAAGASRADAVNNDGIVVGTSGGKAFRYDANTDTFTALDTLGGATGSAYAVSGNGLIAGVSALASGVSHGFLYDGTTISDLGALGADTNSSTARGVNNSGMVVGDSNGHGFLYLNGRMFDLNDLIAPDSGFAIVNAYGINDQGQIIAFGTDASFKTDGRHALLLTPSWSEDATVSPLTVPVTAFTVTKGTNDVAGYLISESATPPDVNDPAWSATAPTSYTFSDYGDKTVYAWAKDSAGMISSPVSQQVTLVAPPAPAISEFAMPATSSSLKVSVTKFTAAGFTGIKGYLITESSTPPAANDANWSATVPTDYTFSADGGDGARTAYAWVKDAAGTVVSNASATVTITRTTTQVSWSNPAEIGSGTALDATQLNATASVPGTFTYTPAAGSLLEPGLQTLTVTFAPTDIATYAPATATATINVVPIGNISGASAVTVADALKALQYTVGLYTPTAIELARGDVSPLVNGKPAPDGKIDVGDALLILKRVVSLVSW
jgi:probable HAF family extracellular repeat protein